MAEDNRVPVWLDCDPGHDDVFAILLAAYHPGIRLLGISTVFGNAPLDKTTWNATSVLTAIGKEREIPVYAGAAKALVRPSIHAADIHGESGLDGTALLPEPAVSPRTDKSATEAAAEALLACHPGTAWVVATGSLTNVANLFTSHPELVAHVAGLSIMGGAIGEGFTAAVHGVVNGTPRIGNSTPWAEFNVFIDPEAAAALLGNRKLAAKTALMPLDVTHLVLASKGVQELLLYGPPNGSQPGEREPGKGKTTLRTMLVELLMFFAKTYADVFGIVDGPPLHDPLAVAAVLVGTPFEIPFYDYDVNAQEDAQSKRERYAVKVVTEGIKDVSPAGTLPDAKAHDQTGRTIATLLPPGEEGVRIPRGLDIPLFWKVLEECVQRADEVNARKGTVDA